MEPNSYITLFLVLTIIEVAVILSVITVVFGILFHRSDLAQKKIDDEQRAFLRHMHIESVKNSKEVQRMIDEGNERTDRLIEESRERTDRLVEESRERTDRLIIESRERTDRLIEEGRKEARRIDEEWRKLNKENSLFLRRIFEIVDDPEKDQGKPGQAAT